MENYSQGGKCNNTISWTKDNIMFNADLCPEYKKQEEQQAKSYEDLGK